MIVKLAAANSFINSLSTKLAKNPHLVDKVKNLSLVGTIAGGDGVLKMVNRNPGESKMSSFGRGALEGAFAGSLIAGADHGIDMLRNAGEKNMSWLAKRFSK